MATAPGGSAVLASLGVARPPSPSALASSPMPRASLALPPTLPLGSSKSLAASSTATPIAALAAALPKVWLQIKIDDAEAGILVIVLRADLVPRTAENFRGLCVGDYGRTSKGGPLRLAGAPFHRIVPGSLAIGGDFENGDGSGGECVYRVDCLPGFRIPDENFALRHTGRGLLSMAGHFGPDSATSCFNLTFGPCPVLDGHCVVFGYVAAGWDVLDMIEACGDADGFPLRRVAIGECGQVPDDGTAQPIFLTSGAAGATARSARRSDASRAASGGGGGGGGGGGSRVAVEEAVGGGGGGTRLRFDD